MQPGGGLPSLEHPEYRDNKIDTAVEVVMTIDRNRFFSTVRALFGGHLRQRQVDGMNAILDGWEAQLENADVRWLAYMLATTFHETAKRMVPVREAFWLPEEWRRRNLPYYPYYGRGYVQLTHIGNYQKAGDYVGADLVHNPDLALRMDYAATIMFVGMTQGWFRRDNRGPHNLNRYFNSTRNDPIGARRIINGYEAGVAEDIADYYRVFLAALDVRLPREYDDELEESFDFDHGLPFPCSRVRIMPVGQRNTTIDTRQMVADIAMAYVSNNTVAPEKLAGLITDISIAIDNAPFLSSRFADGYDDETIEETPHVEKKVSKKTG